MLFSKNLQSVLSCGCVRVDSLLSVLDEAREEAAHSMC